MIRIVTTLLLHLLFGAHVFGAVLEVGPGAPYRKIADALTVAKSGDEIRVHSGIYRERLTIDKAVRLKGEPGAVIDGMQKGSVIVVKQGPCEIRGLTVRGSGQSLVSEDSGIKLHRAADCTIAGNHLEDVLFGIFILSSPQASIVGNYV